MAQQLDMFGGSPPSEGRRTERGRKRTARPSIEQRFTVFHKANPHVIHEMLELARARIARGEKRIGVKALWEELRARLDLIADGGLSTDGPYKLNNDFTAIYARELIARDPRLAEVIELRKRKAKR